MVRKQQRKPAVTDLHLNDHNTFKSSYLISTIVIKDFSAMCWNSWPQIAIIGWLMGLGIKSTLVERMLATLICHLNSGKYVENGLRFENGRDKAIDIWLKDVS